MNQAAERGIRDTLPYNEAFSCRSSGSFSGCHSLGLLVPVTLTRSHYVDIFHFRLPKLEMTNRAKVHAHLGTSQSRGKNRAKALTYRIGWFRSLAQPQRQKNRNRLSATTGHSQVPFHQQLPGYIVSTAGGTRHACIYYIFRTCLPRALKIGRGVGFLSRADRAVRVASRRRQPSRLSCNAPRRFV